MNISDLMNSGLEQYADLGFALLVGGICIRTLLFDRDTNVKQRAIWKHELTELEKSLRQLIDEATEASRSFDHQLNQRQSTLDKLVVKAEGLLKSSISNASRNMPATTKAVSQKNETTPYNRYEKNVATTKDDSRSWVHGDDLPDHLLTTLDEVEDKSSIQSKSLSSKVETVLSNTENALDITQAPSNELSDDEIFQQTSIVDPAAFVIAKRLLLEGKELHIIARKLDMPVSEIRHLEMLIREQAQIQAAELPATFTQREIDSVKKVIRDPATKKKNQKSLMSQIEKLPHNMQQGLKDAYELTFEDDAEDLIATDS